VTGNGLATLRRIHSDFSIAPANRFKPIQHTFRDSREMALSMGPRIGYASGQAPNQMGQML